VIALARWFGGDASGSKTMMVTEISCHTQGFLVNEVDRIVRVDWDKVHPVSSSMANANNLVMASMGLETRKRKNDEEFKDVMSSIFPSKQTTTVMASKAQEPATQAAEPVDFGLQYLRNMRATFQQQ